MSKRRFIEDAAHNLRTPLAIIRTNTELALLSLGEESELKPTLSSILDEVDRMSNMLNDLVTRTTVPGAPQDQE